MEDKGLVTSSSGGEDGRRRYRPTALGERAVKAARVFTGHLAVEAKA
jgi:DNA-binding PadR family transcriptional regulator